jgi:hypothetical protein
MKRGKSILQPGMTRSTRKCYLTGRTDNLQLHHCFPGKNRKTSDEYGFWVYLTQDLHNGSNPGAVHNNPNQGYDLMLKQLCQRKYEEENTRENFTALIGKSYL